jgi:predicted phosphodiesterase
MRILVLSDIHHRYRRVQHLIENVKHDKCILLGDYFDAWGDSDYEAIDTANWLRDKVLYNDKIIALTGNTKTISTFAVVDILPAKTFK